jgi:hypothetical protein
VQSTLPLAPSKVAVIPVDPALTPTTIPDGFTVAVCALAVDQTALDVIVCVVPLGSVAVAVIWTESVRPTPHGEGVTAIAETLGDDVELPQPSAKRMKLEAKSGFSSMLIGHCKFVPVTILRANGCFSRVTAAKPPHSAKAPLPSPPWRRQTCASTGGRSFAACRRVRFLLWCWIFPLAGCAVAFSPGVAPSPTPEKFQDTDKTAIREERMREESTASTSPTFGMSLVVGGQVMDAGGLPKAPFPIVLLH